jgi:hypothetical protein
VEKRVMTVRIRPAVVLVAAGLALSGCIDIECPGEFARPAARERFCGHTGDVARPTNYQPYTNPNAAAVITPSMPPPVAMPAPLPPPAAPSAAPAASPVVVQPVPPPGSAPVQIR